MNEGPRWLGIGAQRCGTSWFTDLLVQHPHMAVGRNPQTGKKVKELHFLYRYGLMRDWDPDARHEYRSIFASEDVKLGEFTPYYMRASWACEITADALPDDAPIIVLVRDPIDRFASALRHEMTLAAGRYREYVRKMAGDGQPSKEQTARRGLTDRLPKKWRQRQLIAKALARGVMWFLAQPKKPPNTFLDPSWMRFVASDATWGGMYATQLDAWTSVFPADRLIVIQYEKLREDPQYYTDLVWKRIGLEPVTLTNVDKRVSTADTERWRKNYGIAPWSAEDYPHVVHALQRVYREDAERLANQFDIDLGLWKRTMTDA